MPIAPAKSKPQKIIHQGKYCRLEPINPTAVVDDLWQNVGTDEELWRYLLVGHWAEKKDFLNWLFACENHQSRCYYTIIDAQNKALGLLCLMDYDLANATIELGGIVFSKHLQKTRIATEAIFLLSEYSLKELGFRRLQWKCHSENEASKKAAKRFGFVFEGVIRNHWITKGKSRDSALFSIIESEWEHHRQAFINWLDEKNFDECGLQKQKLESFR